MTVAAILLLLLVLLGVGLSIYVTVQLRCLRKEKLAKQIDHSLLARSSDSSQESPVFMVKPFLQLGIASGAESESCIEIVWHAQSAIDDCWTVEVTAGSNKQARTLTPICTLVALPDCDDVTVPAHNRYRCIVDELAPGERFEYTVLKNSDPGFTSNAIARKSASQPYRFVAVGDMGNGKAGQKKVAHQIALAAPDLIAMPGDLGYMRCPVNHFSAICAVDSPNT